MDPDLGRYPVVWAAAGLPTAVFPVPPGTLRVLANATVAPIAEERAAADAGPLATNGATSAARPQPGVPGEPGNSTVAYPGGLRARWRWGGSGSGPGGLRPVGDRRQPGRPRPRVASDPDALCRAELRLEGPRGAWTARFASLIHDEPRALHWDSVGLLVVAYGFHTFGLEVETGEARWDHRSATPIVALLGSSRLAHVVVQAELETFAIEAGRDGGLARRPLRRGDRRGAGRWPARPDRLRRPGERARSERPDAPAPETQRLPAEQRCGRAGCGGGLAVDNSAESTRYCGRSRLTRQLARAYRSTQPGGAETILMAAIASTPMCRYGSFGPFHARHRVGAYHRRRVSPGPARRRSRRARRRRR